MTDLIESEDELLDPQPGPAAATPRRLAAAWHRLRTRTPLPTSREPDPERRRRQRLAALLVVAVAAGAGATGVAVHAHDLRHAKAHTQGRMLLHLLGGSPTLSLSELGPYEDTPPPGSLEAPMRANLSIALRNDGAKPLEVSGLQLKVAGVDVLTTPEPVTIPPGDAESLTGRVDVHCAATDLQEFPAGGTVQVRTPAAAGKPAGPATTVPLTFDAGRPSVDPTAEIQPDGLAGTATTSFYRLCGDILTAMPPRVSATPTAGTPTPQNPVVSYSLHIDASPGAQQMAVPLTSATDVPGVSSQTDLAGPRQIGSDGLDVTVTDRITDCTAFGDYLAVRGGATQASEILNTATPIGLQPADPRFRTTPVPLSSTAQPVFDGLTPGTADLQSSLLTELAAACPDL